MVPLFTQIFEQDISAKRDASEKQWCMRVPGLEVPDDEVQITRLAGVIEPPRPVRLLTTGTKYESGRMPSSRPGFADESLDIMRPDGPLEAVKKKQNRASRRGIGVVNIHEVAIRSFESLDTGRVERFSPKELSPQRLQMRIAKPPGGRKGD
jgi:hypothetical protein